MSSIPILFFNYLYLPLYNGISTELIYMNWVKTCCCQYAQWFSLFNLSYYKLGLHFLWLVPALLLFQSVFFKEEGNVLVKETEQNQYTYIGERELLLGNWLTQL